MNLLVVSKVQNNFIMLVYWSHCVYNLFICGGNRGRWPASVKLVTLPTSTSELVAVNAIAVQ